ncbi:GNAT family N-acetyltransferase [Flagellimonas amoyensis]|uniref:GNAT family N-acetyltransferase n=1 Tax=Flagellimonas amoyensis TaxID=2169401 RepID=UPI0028BF2CCE|nr:GNAT family N-acetyltransferase [Allomuricauda amoyensis]
MSKYLLENEASERLLFRSLQPSDFEAWLPFYHDPRSTQYWEGLPSLPEEACKAQFDRVFERYANDLGGMNALTLKNSGQLVGICGLLIQISGRCGGTRNRIFHTAQVLATGLRL